MMHRDKASEAITLLLADADNATEINALARIARRSGFLWHCPTCRQDNYPNRETCCGNQRPADNWTD